METIADRIETTLKRLGISARELSRRAQLPGETQVTQVINRIRKNPNAEVTLPVLNAIAKGAGVSAAWLLTGRGSPDDVAPPAAPQERPRFGDLADWSELLAAAKREEPETPAWVWEKLATMRFELDTPPTPGTVAGAARWVRQNEWVGRPRTPATETGPQQAATGKRAG